MSNIRFAILAGVLGLGIVASVVFGRLGSPFAAAGHRPLKVPFSEFPLRIGEWTGVDRPLTPKEIRIAGMDEYLRRDYRNPAGERILFYLCYYGNREAGLQTIYHNVTVCLPSSGWKRIRTEHRAVTLEDAALQFPVSLHTFRKGAREIVVLCFYVVDGDVLGESPRNDPFRLGLEKLKFGSGPGYYVQAQVVTRVDGAPGEAERRVVRFLKEGGRFIFLHF